LTPVRTCIGCGRKADRDELVRLVLARGEVAVDPSGAEPGRGGHVCPGCAAQAAGKKGAFSRTFRTSVRPPDPERFAEEVRAAASEGKRRKG